MSHSTTISPHQREQPSFTWTRLTKTNDYTELDQRSSASPHLEHEKARGVVNEEVKGTSTALPAHNQSLGHPSPGFSNISSHRLASLSRKPCTPALSWSTNLNATSTSGCTCHVAALHFAKALLNDYGHCVIRNLSYTCHIVLVLLQK